EQMVDGLADDDHVEGPAAEVVFLHETADGFEPESPRLLHFTRRGIDHRAAYAELLREMPGDDARRTADVEHCRKARPGDEGREQLRPLDRVLALLALN